MTNEYKDHPHRSNYHQRKPVNNAKNSDPASLSKTFVFESNGPAGKIRGTAAQLMEKYGAFARDAQREGDSVLSQNFLQHAEHYRIISMGQNASAHPHVSPHKILSPQHSPSEKIDPVEDDEKKNTMEQQTSSHESSAQDEHMRAPRASKKIPRLNRPKILRNYKKNPSPSPSSTEVI